MKTTTKRSFLKMLIDSMKEVFTNVFNDFKNLPKEIKKHLFKQSKMEALQQQVAELNFELDDRIATLETNNQFNEDDFVKADNLVDDVCEINNDYDYATKDEVNDLIYDYDLTEQVEEAVKENMKKYVAVLRSDIQCAEATPVKEVKDRLERQEQLIKLMWLRYKSDISSQVIPDWMLETLKESLK